MNEQANSGVPIEGHRLLKLKALMLSDDGGLSWTLVRQYYLTSVKTNQFLQNLLQGRRFGLLNEEDSDGNAKQDTNHD